MDTAEPVLRHKWLILVLMAMCAFVNAVNSSIVSNALPTMSVDLGVPSGSISWIVTIFLIVTISTILLFGRLGDLLGHIRVLQTGLLVFIVGTVLCGAAASFPVLLAARVIQGLGASMVYANNQGIITALFPASERGRALGVNIAFVALGNLTGPSIGGAILSVASWHWLFWAMVPVAAALLVLQHIYLPREGEVRRREKLDVVGTVLLIAAVVTLFVALQELQSQGLRSPLVLGCLACGAVCLPLFLLRQKRCPYAMLDLSMFKNQIFNINLFCAATSHIAIQVYTLVMPFYFQSVLMMSAGRSGLFMTVYPIILVCASPVSGAVLDRIGRDKITVAGLLLMVAGLYLVSTLDAATPPAVIIAYIACLAFGNGLFQSPNNALIMSSVDRSHVGIAGSVNALVRNVGQNIGTVLSSSLLYFGISASLGYHVNTYDGRHPEAFAAGMDLTFRVVCLIALAGAVLSIYRCIYMKKKQRGKTAEQ